MPESDEEPMQPRGVASGKVAPVGIRVTGTVKWFNIKSAYGFVTRDGTNDDYFVHRTAFKRDACKPTRSLESGQKVEFEATRSVRGLEALNLTAPGGKLLRNDLKRRRRRCQCRSCTRSSSCASLSVGEPKTQQHGDHNYGAPLEAISRGPLARGGQRGRRDSSNLRVVDSSSSDWLDPTKVEGHRLGKSGEKDGNSSKPNPIPKRSTTNQVDRDHYHTTHRPLLGRGRGGRGARDWLCLPTTSSFKSEIFDYGDGIDKAREKSCKERSQPRSTASSTPGKIRPFPFCLYDDDTESPEDDE